MQTGRMHVVSRWYIAGMVPGIEGGCVRVYGAACAVQLLRADVE